MSEERKNSFQGKYQMYRPKKLKSDKRLPQLIPIQTNDLYFNYYILKKSNGGLTQKNTLDHSERSFILRDNSVKLAQESLTERSISRQINMVSTGKNNNSSYLLKLKQEPNQKAMNKRPDNRVQQCVKLPKIQLKNQDDYDDYNYTNWNQSDNDNPDEEQITDYIDTLI